MRKQTALVTGLSATAARRIARTATATVVVIALSAAALSYAGLHRLSVQAGVHPHLAVLVPVVVDGMILCGMLAVLYTVLTGLSARYPWLIVLLGVVASTFGNVLAAPDDVVSRVLHGFPPVALALVLELALSVVRHRAGLPTTSQARRQRTSSMVEAGTAPSSTSGQVEPECGPGGPARRPSPAAETAVVRPGSRRARIAALLAEQPDLNAAEIARSLGIDSSDTRKIVREIRDTNAQQPRPTLTLAAAGSA